MDSIMMQLILYHWILEKKYELSKTIGISYITKDNEKSIFEKIEELNTEIFEIKNTKQEEI